MSTNDMIFRKLTEKFGSKLSSTSLSSGEPVVEVDRAVAKDVLSFLKADKDLSFDMLVELFGVDYPDEDPRFEVDYILRSTKTNDRIRVKTRTADSDIETVSDLWLAANWLEREAFDMFGIRFSSHPDLHRIYNEDDFEGYPLRKDFPTEGYNFDKTFTVNLEENKG
jgi:NADH-quinone oxidoreductase subunit C